MGVTKQILKKGNGVDIPKKHDEISIEYTGWLYTEEAADHKGRQYDSSVGRGELVTEIGVGRVIRGWDEGILGSASTSPMSLGEKSTLTVTPDYAYGKHGFPNFIPPNATLVFDLELKSINGKRE